TRLTAYEEQELTEKWQALLGPSNEVVVAQVEKFSESSGLGVSLEASGGHHYVRSVLPEGPVGRCGKLFSGDELLEVNGVSLIGESHKEVVRILKELPLCVYMACCRPAPVPQTRVDAGQSEVLSADSLVKNTNRTLGGFLWSPKEDGHRGSVTTAVVGRRPIGGWWRGKGWPGLAMRMRREDARAARTHHPGPPPGDDLSLRSTHKLTPRRSEPLDEMPSFALDATEPFSSPDTSLAFGPPGYEVYPGANASVGGSGFADPADGVDLYGGSEPPEVGGRGDEVERAEVVESRRYDGDDAIGNTNSLFTKDGSELARLPAGGDSGEETATLGGNFERTITVVKGNASL
ncbi:hypothetical protein CRUP_034701, partial [Coryphaenoides rupestris]